MHSRIIAIVIFFVGSSLQALQYEQKEQTWRWEELISVMEGSINGSLTMSTPRWGQYTNCFTGDREAVAATKLKDYWLYVRNRMRKIPEVTLKDKLALLSVEQRRHEVRNLIHTNLSQEEIVAIQVHRMKCFLMGWGSIQDRDALIKVLNEYKKENDERCAILERMASDEVADLLINWHKVIMCKVDMKQENCHHAFNKRMSKIADLVIKPLRQELYERAMAKEEKETSDLAQYRILENW